MNAKGLSIGAMVFGILGVVFSWLPFVVYIAFPCAIVGIVMAAIAMKKIKEGSEGSKGMAIAGLVCGIVGCAFGLPMLICNICICAAGTAATGALNDLANQLGNM